MAAALHPPSADSAVTAAAPAAGTVVLCMQQQLQVRPHCSQQQLPQSCSAPELAATAVLQARLLRQNPQFQPHLWSPHHPLHAGCLCWLGRVTACSACQLLCSALAARLARPAAGSAKQVAQCQQPGRQLPTAAAKASSTLISWGFEALPGRRPALLTVWSWYVSQPAKER